MFFVGSVFFLPSFSPVQTISMWLFIIGSLPMMIGALASWA